MGEDQKQNIQIEIFEHYGEHCLKDKFGLVEVTNRKPKGFVEIYETTPDGTKKLIEKSNLVLYTGREWIAERIFNTNNTHVTSSPGDAIYWYGVGDGGAPILDPLTPTAPTNTDTGLGNDVPISTDSTNADFRISTYYKKPIYSVEFQQDTYNNNTYLIAKATLILESGDSNGYNISEAGLFASPSSAGGDAGPFTCYARVTFPSIVKSVGRILTFIWYVFV
jgi:hypothetical protein